MSSMVPSQRWGRDSALAFGSESGNQRIGCVKCLKNDEFDIPDMIFYINGTSFCAQHATTVV